METLAFGYGLVEAPRIDGAGNLYFSDAIDGGGYRRAPDGAMSVVVPRRRGVGGLVLHADGGVVVSGRDVSHVREGETRILLTVEGVLASTTSRPTRRGMSSSARCAPPRSRAR